MSDEALTAVNEHGRVLFTEEAAEVVPGVFVSGTVPRHNDFEKISEVFFLDEALQEEDVLEDDMSAALLTEKGLIIISGCAHSGIINSVNHMKDVTGCDKVLAVIGGFHLGGASSDRIEQTVAGLKKICPEYVCAGHCTGDNALRELKQAFGERFIRLHPGKELLFR